MQPERPTKPRWKDGGLYNLGFGWIWDRGSSPQMVENMSHTLCVYILPMGHRSRTHPAEVFRMIKDKGCSFCQDRSSAPEEKVKKQDNAFQISHKCSPQGVRMSQFCLIGFMGTSSKYSQQLVHSDEHITWNWNSSFTSIFFLHFHVMCSLCVTSLAWVWTLWSPDAS